MFGIRTAIFSLTLFPVGQLLSRFGPGNIATISSIVYGLGHLLPSINPASLLLLGTGMGVLAGLGMGGGYLTALRLCASMIPSHKGLLIGCGAGAFGAGAIVASKLGSFLLQTGFGITHVFALFGLVYGTICLLSAQLCPSRVPSAPDEHLPPHDRPPIPARRVIGACFLAKLTANFGGLLVIGNMHSLAQNLGLSVSAGLTGIATFSFGNAIGRVIWGAWFDRWGRNTVLFAMMGLAGSLAGVERFGRLELTFALLTCVIGFCFSSGFVLHASLLTDQYGPVAVQNVYPLVFSAHGIGAIFGPPLGARFIGAWGNASMALFLATGIVLFGIISFVLLMRDLPRSHAPVDELRAAAVRQSGG